MLTPPLKDEDMSLLPDEIPVDDHVRSYDPDDDDTADSAFTVASTLHDFSYEHGRRYPSYRTGPQAFPHDDLSQKNNKILHHMLLFLLDNRYFLAPIQTPRSILDVKCGEGFWAENVADAFPDAQVVAMDTTPMERSTYPNLSHVVQSFNDEWILDTPDMKFDLIYARNLFATTSDFPLLYKQAFDNMAPGGYFEQFEIEIRPHCDDESATPNSAINRFPDMVPELSETSGVEFAIANQMTHLVAEAGFADIQEVRFKLPLGPWSADLKYKQVGEWFEAFYKSGLQGWVLAPMTRNMGISPEQVNKWCEECFREVDQRNQHLYFVAVFVHCRKPE